MAGGSASALSLSRPAQASLTLRPTGLLNRLKRPMSRGSSPAGYPTEPLVSYQINRQLSGWNLPPLVIRAFGAHCHKQTCGRRGIASVRTGAGTEGWNAATLDERRAGELMSNLLDHGSAVGENVERQVIRSRELAEWRDQEGKLICGGMLHFCGPSAILESPVGVRPI